GKRMFRAFSFGWVVALRMPQSENGYPAGTSSRMAPMIALFTDFGLTGPYTGQVKAVLHLGAPQVPVIDLFADAPSGRPLPSSYLLAAYGAWLPAGTILLCVVDPGVGTPRPAVVVEADSRWFVGPANGLFEIVFRRASKPRVWEITWR